MSDCLVNVLFDDDHQALGLVRHFDSLGLAIDLGAED
jgi:hypothetical protein